MIGLTFMFTACPEDEVEITVACFEPDNEYVSVGENVYFSNCSENADQYGWTFGDGSISNETSPIHTYASAGIYDVTLTAYNRSVTDQITKVITVTGNGISACINANYSSAEVGQEITFTNCSENADYCEITYGDGDSEYYSDENPNYFYHTYSTPGNYNITLTVYNNDNNNYDTDYVSVYITEQSGDCLSPTNYFMGFEDGEDLTGWQYIDANIDNAIWGTWTESGIGYSNAAGYEYDSINSADDWLYTPCFDLSAYKTYEISFYYAAAYASYPEKMALYYNTSISEDNATLLVDLGTFYNTTFEYSTTQFTVPSSGTYHFGWYCYSDADMAYAMVDNISIKEVTKKKSASTAKESNTTLSFTKDDGKLTPASKSFNSK